MKNMQNMSGFEAGRRKLRSLLLAALLCCVVTFFVPAGNIKLGFTFATLLVFLSIIWVLVKECRCPYCGKVIFFNALNTTYCPHCRRSLSTGKKQKKGR